MTDLITKLIDEIGPGHMASTAYDTAWTARLGEIDWASAVNRWHGYLRTNYQMAPGGHWLPPIIMTASFVHLLP